MPASRPTASAAAAPPAPPSAPLRELARSMLDLWHHVDGIEARRFDGEGPEPELRPIDRETLKQHAAAFRSVEGATLELDLTTLDDEIDRTILLAAIRPQIRRLDRDHPERRNPTFWTGRLLAVLETKAGDATTLARIPTWVDHARTTVASPPFAFLQLALDDLAAARAALARPEWWLADKEALSQAAAALDRLDQFFRHETIPNPAPDAAAIGEEAVAWQLHYSALIEAGGAEAARRLGRHGESLRQEIAALGDPPPPGGPALDLAGTAAAYRQGLRHQPSEIRRRVAAPAWLDGFALFAAGEARSAGGSARLARTQLARLDLEIQLGRQDAGKALVDPTGFGASVIRHPLETVMAALLALEWEALRAKWFGDTGSFIAAVLEHGVMHPALAGWRLGLG